MNRLGGWGTNPFTRQTPAAPAPSSFPRQPTPAAQAPAPVTRPGDTGPSFGAQRSPEEQGTRQEITDRLRALGKERDALEESLQRAAPHEWPAIYEQLRELDRDLGNQSRMLQLADRLSAVGGDAGDWHRLGGWAARAQRASTENQTRLEFQVEQLVRAASGFPIAPSQGDAYASLAGEIGRTAERIAALQNQLDANPAQGAAGQLRLELGLAEQSMDNLKEAKAALDSLASDPEATPAQWHRIQNQIGLLANAAPEDRERLVANIQLNARRDGGDSAQSASERKIYLQVGELQQSLNARVNALQGEIAGGQASPQVRQQLSRLERQRDTLVSLEQSISRLEHSGANPQSWARLEALFTSLAASLGNPTRFDQLAQQIRRHSSTLPQPAQRPEPPQPTPRPLPVEPVQEQTETYYSPATPL